MTARQLKTIRKLLKWSQSSLAEEIGVDRQTVHRWETGKTAIAEPCARLIRRIAKEKGIETVETDGLTDGRTVEESAGRAK